LAIYRTLPNMVVMHPCDTVSTRELTKQLVELNSPSYTRTARNKTPVVHSGREDEIKIGKGIVLKDGSDVAIIACGVLVHEAMKAAEDLASQGVSAAVIDMHTLKPLDNDLIDRYVAKCGSIVTAEDHSIIGGLGSAVAEYTSSNKPVPIERIGVKDRFGESGEAQQMLDLLHLSSPHISEAAKRAVARKA
jgi:transketolase